MKPKWIILLLLLPSVQFITAQDKRSVLPPGLDAYIAKALQTFDVPGMSVAIVKDGKALLAKGYGIKKLGGNAPVDANTLFAIASNSKAFTGTALAMLAEEGKLKWDEPVVTYLPWFKTSDTYITANLTVRDLLVHQSGIPAYAGDLMLFPPSNYSRQEIIRRIRFIPFVNGFRTTYAYDNIFYLVAGEVIHAVSGLEWEDFIKTRIFDKVGMQGSVSRISTFKDQPNISAAHFRLNGVIKEIPGAYDHMMGDAGNPAGGILSNANDMAKWLITHLDSGRMINKQALFKPSTTNELWKIVRPMPIYRTAEAIKPARANFYGYALGFRALNYGKYKMIIHGGKLDGFVSQVAMIPELNLGVCVLTNQESAGAYWSVIYHILDYYMNNKPFDWTAGYKQVLDSSLAQLSVAQKKEMIPRDSTGCPSLALEKYAGTFRDELCGDFTISKNGDKLILQFDFSPQFIADVEHFHHDVFIATFRNKDLKADAYITYSLNPDLSIDQIKLRLIDPDSDLNFSALRLIPVKKK